MLLQKLRIGFSMKSLVFFVLFYITALFACASPFIRVALDVQASWISVSCREGLVVLFNGTPLFKGTQANFADFGDKIRVNGKVISSPQLYVKSNAPFSFEGKMYRGNLEILNTGHGLDAINILPVEKYLYSVVGSEMPSNWPLEALKAQAVLARTYALKKIEERKAFPYDVLATYADQAYEGIDEETPATREAVNETRGIVVLYGEKLIMAYYHSDCGGKTENGSSVFKGDFPYLKSVVCPFDKDAPYRNWSKTYSLAELSELFEKKIIGVSIQTNPVSNHVEKVFLHTPQGLTAVPATLFRRLLGLREIRSTYFRVVPIVHVVYVPKIEKVPIKTVATYASTKIAKTIFQAKTKQLPQHVYVMDGTGSLTLTSVSPQNPFVILSGNGTLSIKSGNLFALFLQSSLVFKRIIYPLGFKKIMGKKLVWVKVKVPAAFTFLGSGWGHGVGLCQWGARGMALLGKTYREILHYYYTGVHIEKLANSF
jgi:stage II sporulation protein D